MMGHPIGWEIWDTTAMRVKSQSVAHLESDDGRTLCGVRIPEEGNGICFTETSHLKDCKRCARKADA